MEDFWTPRRNRKSVCNYDENWKLDTSRFSAPMPAVGLYIALASVACIVLAAMDTAIGFKARGKEARQKFWFPSKWFGINAATLTLLSIATKLTVDLNTGMPGPHHQLTKLNGTVMLSASTAFFLPCFGEMTVGGRVSNLAALILLIITVTADIGIQMGTGAIFALLPEHILVLCFMFLITLNVLIAATGSDEVKRELDESYRRVVHKLNSVWKKLKEMDTDSEEACERAVPHLQEFLKRRLYMTRTMCSREVEYAMIRSPNGSAVAVLSVLSTLVLVQAEVRSLMSWAMLHFSAQGTRMSYGITFCYGESDYEWSLWFVLLSQAAFIILITVPVFFRWFEGTRFVRHPIKEMLSWRSLLADQTRFSGFRVVDNRRLQKFIHSLGLLITLISMIISRGSCAVHCIGFWLLKRLRLRETERLDPNEAAETLDCLVHLKEEQEFRDWLYARYRSDAMEEERRVLSHICRTSIPDGIRIVSNTESIRMATEMIPKIKAWMHALRAVRRFKEAGEGIQGNFKSEEAESIDWKFFYWLLEKRLGEDGDSFNPV